MPLIARIPGGARGAFARGPVQLFDVPHTMALLAGLDVRGDGSGAHGINFAESLLPQLRDGADGDLSRPVYAEGGFQFRNELFPGARAFNGSQNGAPVCYM